MRDGGAGGSGTPCGLFRVGCCGSVVRVASLQGARFVLGGRGGGSGGVLMERVRTDDRAGGTAGTGGAFTGGLTVEVEVGCCLRLTGAALYRTGWLDVEVAFGGVTGDLTGAGGGCGVRAFGLLLLALLADRDRCVCVNMAM